MRLIKLFLAFVFLLTMTSCMRKSYKEFVNKHFDKSFSKFINKSIYVRGREDRNTLVLFVDSDLSEGNNEGPYIVTINQHLRKIMKTSSHLMIDTTNIDKKQLNNLAIAFLSYDVESLKVDSNENVFIGLVSREKPDLVRFSNEKYKTIYYNDGWVKVKGNWYMRID